jgi:sulfhydrogenase subunit gamma (sulfur reductase)
LKGTLWPDEIGSGGVENIYLPRIAKILDIHPETADVKTFVLQLKDDPSHSSFDFKPGQFVEVGVFGVGEVPIGLSSSPYQKGSFEITVRAVGSVTNALHRLSPDDEVGIRGPLGNSFPFEEVMGKDILFIGGGIGLPPLRSLIRSMFERRDDFGKITILYGARTPGDRTYKAELARWAAREDIEFHETVDVGDDSWTGNIGVVTTLLKKVKVDPNRTVAYTCGPPIMIKFVIEDLLSLGFPGHHIVTTLERYMKCGVGKCRHCCIGHKYVCLDGPVFTYQQISELTERV